MKAIIHPASQPLFGAISLPGDKSISQRRALLSLFVEDEISLRNFGNGEDCQSALECIAKLGKTVIRDGAEIWISGGKGCISADLNCGNSGTTARLLMGILSGQAGEWTLRGDESLSKRPMERVAQPLREMGAHIELTHGGLPAKIYGRKLKGISFESSFASAQLKSSILLAGLSAEGTTKYKEKIKTRDHTEKILGILPSDDGWLELNPNRNAINADSLQGLIPGDPSSAAFWIVASLLIPESSLTLKNVLANPERIEIIQTLKKAEGNIKLSFDAVLQNEPAACIVSQYGNLSPITIEGVNTVKLIDEIPILAVLANSITGTSHFNELDELRVKESDRLALILKNLKNMNARVDQSLPNNLTVIGRTALSGAEIETEKDHRIAMAFAVAGLYAQGMTVIKDCECTAVSYPDFWADFQKIAPHCLSLIN